MQSLLIISFISIFSTVTWAQSSCRTVFSELGASKVSQKGQIPPSEYYSKFVELINRKDYQYSTLQELQEIIESPGFDLEHRWPNGKSVFQIAAERNNKTVTALFFKLGFDPFKRFPNGKNALIEVVESGSSGYALEQIVSGRSYGALSKVKNPRQALPSDFFIFNSDGSFSKDSIGETENIEVLNKIFKLALLNGNLPLASHFVETYHVRDFLVDPKIPKVQLSREEEEKLGGLYLAMTELPSVLKMALQSKSPQLISYLLTTAKIDPNTLLPDVMWGQRITRTALNFAISEIQSPAIVEILLKNGADPYLKDPFPQPELQTAMGNAIQVWGTTSNPDFVKILEKYGVKRHWLHRLRYRY